MRKNYQGTLIYKCRKCGRVYDGVHAPDALVTCINLMQNIKLPYNGIPVRAYNIHACNPVCIGIADLIGANYDEMEGE